MSRTECAASVNTKPILLLYSASPANSDRLLSCWASRPCNRWMWLLVLEDLLVTSGIWIDGSNPDLLENSFFLQLFSASGAENDLRVVAYVLPRAFRGPLEGGDRVVLGMPRDFIVSTINHWMLRSFPTIFVSSSRKYKSALFECIQDSRGVFLCHRVMS